MRPERAVDREREHDVVLFGATGFTGGLTATYLATHAPADLRWAIAGRSSTRLAAVADRLEQAHPDRPRPDVVLADVDDASSLAALAASTRLVATTVGPYLQHGRGVVAACAESGTDYVDITGEPEFVDTVWLEQHARAEQTGARLVHACGFDSVPHDLGVWFTLRGLPDDLPVTVEGYVEAHAGFSAGTFNSAVRALGRLRHGASVAARRGSLERHPAGRRVSALPSRPRRMPTTGRWAVPLPTIDPVIVRRSARALPAYGPDFRYGHYAVVGSLPAAAAALAGTGALLALASVPATRNVLLRLKTPGEGPAAERRAAAWFRVTFVAEAGDQRLVAEVSGGDPGYQETAKMLAESAMCLLSDDLPVTSGQVTTAQAMGDALLTRLREAGMNFRVLEPQPT